MATLAIPIEMVPIALGVANFSYRDHWRTLDADQIMPLNEAWHRANPMPKKPTLEQRISWHLAHARECGCRKIRDKLQEEIKKRGLA